MVAEVGRGWPNIAAALIAKSGVPH
jgi:hypothetical protein